MIAFQFLEVGALAPFSSLRWPPPGEWLSAPRDRPDRWIHACRPRDLSHWVGDELWRVELAEPVREERYRIASPLARLLSRIPTWDRNLASEYAAACVLRARDLALPHVPPPDRDALARAADVQAIGAAARPATRGAAALVADAAWNALHEGPSTTSYVAAVLASSLGGGLAAFEAERTWQARWLSERLGLGPVPPGAPAGGASAPPGSPA